MVFGVDKGYYYNKKASFDAFLFCHLLLILLLAK